MIDSKPRHNGAVSLDRRPSSSKLSSPPVVVKKEKVVTQRKVSADKGKGREIPSRTPSPPGKIVVKGGKHIYTDEDKEFLVKYATYRYNEDPNLKKVDIATEMAQKVRSVSV